MNLDNLLQDRFMRLVDDDCLFVPYGVHLGEEIEKGKFLLHLHIHPQHNYL